MTTAPRLHATAALHSLTDALTHLTREAAAEAAHIAAERLDAPACLRSPAWGRRHALGGHGDPTATTYLAGGVPFRVNRPQALLDDLGEQVAALAKPLPGTGTPLDRIGAAIPTMRPDIAQAAARALHRLDEVARRHLHLAPARAPLTGQPCHHCGHRRLEVTTAGPPADCIVVCAHCDAVWPRAAVIGAVAGAAPTHTR